MTANQRDPDNFLGYTIVRLAAAMQTRIEDVMRQELGLSVRQFGALAHLARNPGMGSGELARLLLVKPQSMGPLVDGLAERGLVVRNLAARGHKRRTELTQGGRSALARGYAVADRLAIEDAAGLTREDAARLNVTLLAILDRLQR